MLSLFAWFGGMHQFALVDRNQHCLDPKPNAVAVAWCCPQFSIPGAPNVANYLR